MTCNYALAEKLKNRFYIRDEAMRCSANANYRRRANRRNAYARISVREVYPAKPQKNGRYDVSLRQHERNTVSHEMKVEKKHINPLYIVGLLVTTVMMIALVMSFARVYQTANVVADLERKLETLESEKDDLALQLEEKNDLRVVETIATTKLGMVKEDSLQRKYVSLSEGERIVVAENDEPADVKTGGVMLSSVLSSIGKFFDNFR